MLSLNKCWPNTDQLFMVFQRKMDLSCKIRLKDFFSMNYSKSVSSKNLFQLVEDWDQNFKSRILFLNVSRILFILSDVDFCLWWSVGLDLENTFKSHSWPDGFPWPLWHRSLGDVSKQISRLIWRRWWMPHTCYSCVQPVPQYITKTLDMPEWQETTEQTGRRAKQPSQVVCYSEDLKYWGAWDSTCRHKAKDITRLMAWRREAWTEEVRDNLPWKDERGPSSIRQTLELFQGWQHWGNLWELGWSTYGIFQVDRY